MSKHKESSDSLAHPIVEPAHIVVPERRRTAGDYFAMTLATCGVGLIPVAPGTWGSGVGVVLYLGLGLLAQRVFDYAVVRGLDLAPQQFPAILTTLLLLVILLVALVGTWAATRAEKLLGKKDPGAVVVDEVAGQLITFLFVPWQTTWTWTVAAGFRPPGAAAPCRSAPPAATAGPPAASGSTPRRAPSAGTRRG